MFVMTMLLNTNLLIIEKKIISFCPKKHTKPAPSNVFLNGAHAHFSGEVKYLGALSNVSLKDDNDIQRQVKLLHCAALIF